ncbi:hypothetical protein ACGFZQ_25990 [Streptomyces sp. NPDC048254]|uniref:hypothetical protein n=1 Tax=Streptomyces sp. NPDC048254 TaxID=3365525 RepID=UPI0037233BD2
MGTAGNAATTQALRDAKGKGVSRPAAVRSRPVAPVAPVEEKRTEPGLVLPPYLMDFRAAGLSTAYGLTGHEFVRNAVAAVVGHGDGTVADIGAELAGRPESFYGQGRAFAVQGRTGKEWFDVTVSISRAPDDRPPVFHPKDLLANTVPDPDGAPLAAVDEAEGKDTKVDVQHNSAATVATTASGGAGKGLGGMAFGLAPVVPGLWLGGAGLANAQPWQSSRESRSQRNVAEPRVLRSEKGSVEAPRKVRYGVRIKKHGAPAAQVFHGSGALTQRVPTEHLVPAGTAAPAAPQPLQAGTARRVSRADSMAPVAVTDSAAPHQGGGGLFDAVAGVLHPSLTAPGAPGRARLYEATSPATVLEDMPRLLRDGVTGEDLASKDGSSVGSYRMHAEITGMSPACGTGGTQLRTHQQTQHTVTESAGKGRAVTGGLGPAIGVGAVGNAAVVRATAMPVAAARKARFTVAEQTVSSRQGAEVRGDKVLYLATVQFTAEGTGPRSAENVLRPGTRVARHAMRVWMSLRADEARSLGLPLPPGTEAKEFIEKPKRTDEDGNEVDVDVTMTSRQRKLGRALTPGSPGQDAPEARPMAGLHLEEQDVRLVTPTEFTLDEEGKRRQDAVGDRRRAQTPRPDHAVTAEGIGDLATLVPRPSTGQALRDWQLVETVGDGQAVRDLAFQLLSRAAARNKGVREDPALAAEGLAPRLAIEERFGPQAVTAALRQAASAGWVVKNLRYPRRLAALNGAVGTRLTLAHPKFLHRGAGPGTETFVLGGHQAAGQEGRGTTSTWQAGATGSENGPEWRLGQGLSGSRTTSEGDARSAALSGTVERNAHTPKKAPLHLVQCDLLVTMVAEVKVTGGGPYVATAGRTLPAEAAVWLTERSCQWATPVAAAARPTRR